MVYSIFLTTSWEYDKHQMVTFMAIYWDFISSTNLWIEWHLTSTPGTVFLFWLWVTHPVVKPDVL